MGTDAREHGDAHARPERVRQVDGLQSALARTRQDLLRVRDHEHFIGVRRRRGRVRRRLRRLGPGRLAHTACRADDRDVIQGLVVQQTEALRVPREQRAEAAPRRADRRVFFGVVRN